MAQFHSIAKIFKDHIDTMPNIPFLDVESIIEQMPNTRRTLGSLGAFYYIIRFIINQSGLNIYSPTIFDEAISYTTEIIWATLNENERKRYRSLSKQVNNANGNGQQLSNSDQAQFAQDLFNGIQW
ncbi:3340_t:CDS:1 [Acaulospora morrowiae]|uniref:3340_t:CDS:1 n=1 Tax=Acaulospora morrowiae TaxID=94023 RepID=A0A9N9IU04_9GLOM|nr:3340_t:CDS:1 [Acaulospora morrowiae]